MVSGVPAASALVGGRNGENMLCKGISTSSLNVKSRVQFDLGESPGAERRATSTTQQDRSEAERGEHQQHEKDGSGPLFKVPTGQVRELRFRFFRRD